MRVALYIRVSTDEQAKSRYSIPDQERTLREHATVFEERTPDNPLGLYHLTPDRVRPKTEEELADERLAAENERSARLRHLYEAIGLSVTAHKDGTLFLRWSCGQQALPPVTGSESPVLRRIFATDDG